MLEKTIHYFENSTGTIISIAVVLVTSMAVYYIAKRGLKAQQKSRKLAAPLVATIIVLLRWVIVLITALLVLQQFGVLPNVWAAVMAVLAAVAIGLVAGWSVLSNVLSTFLILIYRPFRIGDVVEIPTDQIKGEVIDLNFMHTSLRESENRFVRVPNNTFFLKSLVCIPGEQSISLYEQLQSDTPHDA